MLRGGRPGRTYWTDEVYEGADEAKGRLALDELPKVRLAFRITNQPKLELGIAPFGRMPTSRAVVPSG